MDLGLRCCKVTFNLELIDVMGYRKMVNLVQVQRRLTNIYMI